MSQSHIRTRTPRSGAKSSCGYFSRPRDAGIFVSASVSTTPGTDLKVLEAVCQRSIEPHSPRHHARTVYPRFGKLPLISC